MIKKIGKKEEDAMSKQNKFSKLAVLSLLGVLALTGCDESTSKIKAKPSNYNDPIVTIEGNTEKIHNDVLKIIYDAMRDGSIASNTLDKVLYRYAQSIYGSYNKLTLSDNDESITLKEAAADLHTNSTTHEVADNFIRAHKVYWTYNDEGEHIDVDGNVIKEGKSFNPTEDERQRVSSRFDDIETRIAENMFSKIESGSYSEKHFFSEKKFVKSLYEDGQNVIKYRDLDDSKQIIEYTVEGKDVFEEEILHREYYQTHFGLSEDETQKDGENDFHYIEKEIVPAIYSDLLVEQYLLDEEATAVRNSRARQINVIKIEKYSDFTINADLLVRELVKEIYSTRPADSDNYLAYVDEEHNPFEEMFKKYQDIAKGLYDEIDHTGEDEPNPTGFKPGEIIKRINNSRSDAFKVNAYKVDPADESTWIRYYENTAYGDLVKEYEKFHKAEKFDEIDSELLTKFTDNGKMSEKEGFNQAVIDIDQTQAITKGWYIQKSAPSLDSNGKIKENLFQVSVANTKREIKNAEDVENLEELAKTDRIVKEGDTWKVRDAADPKENKFLCSINGAFFLKFEGNYSGTDYTNDIVYDDGSAYYIVQVLEAVKDSKLRNSLSENSYARTRSPEFLEKVISEVTKEVAETGNYSSLAKEYWLKKMSIKYHDQVIYDYFKSNYPDLFD